MKNKIFRMVILSVIMICASCVLPGTLSILPKLEGESGLSYDESWDKWNELKNTHGNSYVYQTKFQSFAGFGSTTEIRVRDNRVVARIYEAYDSNGKCTDSYYESQNSVGNHEEGADPLTIDELYETCISDYLVVDEENNTVYFHTTEYGLMTKCGYVQNGCQDDCYFGITIDGFRWWR